MAVMHDFIYLKFILSKCRIQAVWRGFVVRCWFQKLLEANPPKEKHLRRKFYEAKLSEITSRMIKSMAFDVDGLFEEIDKNVAESRKVLQRVQSVELQKTDWSVVQMKVRI